jgi:hypothetical protein
MSLHEMNRRRFLETASAVSAATLLTTKFGWATSEHKIPKDRIGVQLYTVRFAMEKDFDGSLAKGAGAGYKEVELAEFSMDGGEVSYFKKTPQDVKSALDHFGLDPVSTHLNYKFLTPDSFPKVLEASKVLGHKYIVCPWIDEEFRKDPDVWRTPVTPSIESANRARTRGSSSATTTTGSNSCQLMASFPTTSCSREPIRTW